MSRVRSRNTKPELLLKKKLKGFIYQPKAFGKPDFINYKKKIVIFIDGCFWHKCPKHFRAPASNRKYWLPKIAKNALRGKEITLAYKIAGWKVRRIWEHDLSSQKGLKHAGIERLHNNVRARTKVFRGFYGSLRSANLILKGYEIYYNFIRINQAINKCPYELATDLKLKEKNKWLELIKLSSTLHPKETCN